MYPHNAMSLDKKHDANIHKEEKKNLQNIIISIKETDDTYDTPPFVINIHYFI